MDFKLYVISFSIAVLCHFGTEVSCAIGGNSGWSSSPDAQYHIQTDEGAERFFRYQTTSGQYRKEKRLEDGTVIGTSGWVDPNGMLRLSDYIADDKGYRILRNKIIYVGHSEDIGKGVSKAKNVPAQSGTLVTQNMAAPTILKSVESSTARPYYNPVSVTPISVTESIGYPSSTPSYGSKFDTSYQYPKPTVDAIGVVYSNQNSIIPEKSYPTYTNPFENYRNRPSYPFSDRSSAQTQNYDTQYREPYKSQTRGYENFGQRTKYVNNYDHPEGNQNSLGGQIPEGYGNKLPEYDGISTTKDGFRYYLPRQYHEEISSPSGETRTGSFGYIDPFGIRRVTYYNTNPGSGFIHRKNNRYVGFNANPYDPRF